MGKILFRSWSFQIHVTGYAVICLGNARIMVKIPIRSEALFPIFRGAEVPAERE